ncbi:MAG: YcbK family protein [Nitrospirae bacterium]|nr:YcbK family protein [Nitrospirota bacterium]
MKPDKSCDKTNNGLSRRSFLALGAATVATTLFPSYVTASLEEMKVPERSLYFYNIHTDEKLKTVYWQDNAYIPDSLAEINFILRDYRTGGIKDIDTKLLDLLYVINKKMKARQPFHVMSGYRSPETNAMLRKTSRGVGSNSFHIYGMAVDIKVPGRSIESLRNIATKLKAGGVGYYPRSNFVHVDIGSVRYW